MEGDGGWSKIVGIRGVYQELDGQDNKISSVMGSGVGVTVFQLGGK